MEASRIKNIKKLFLYFKVSWVAHGLAFMLFWTYWRRVPKQGVGLQQFRNLLILQNSVTRYSVYFLLAYTESRLKIKLSTSWLVNIDGWWFCLKRNCQVFICIELFLVYLFLYEKVLSCSNKQKKESAVMSEFGIGINFKTDALSICDELLNLLWLYAIFFFFLILELQFASK